MIKRIFAPLLAALFFASFFGTLAGCNTVEGAGKDIEQGGIRRSLRLLRGVWRRGCRGFARP